MQRILWIQDIVPGILPVLIAQATTILGCLYFAWVPPVVLGVLAVILAIGCFYRGYFLLLGVCLGLAAVSWHVQLPAKQSLYDCTLEAQVLDSGKETKRVILSASKISCANETLANQQLLFWDNNHLFSAQPDRRWQLSGQLAPVKSTQNRYTFNYEKYLISQGIYYQLKDVKVHDTSDDVTPLIKLRHYLRQTFQTNLSEANAAIATALVTGNRDDLTDAQRMTMQNTGTSHLLAISGLHVGLVGGWVWLMVQYLWALSFKLSRLMLPIRAGAWAALLAILAYAALTGFDTPVQRATIMFALLLLSWLLSQRLNSQSLLLAAALVLLFDPYALLSVGFYLSFIATFLVIWSMQLAFSPFIKVLIMQALISLLLMPIVWFSFGIVSFSSFWVNLLVIPWLTFCVLPWAFVGVIVAAIHSGLAEPLWHWLDFALSAMWLVITQFASFDWAVNTTWQPNVWLVGWLVLFGILFLLYHKQRRIVVVITIMMTVGLGVFILSWIQPRSGEIWLADTRQTSVLIHNGQSAIIIDPGRRYRQINQAEKWLRLLKQHGLALEAIVLTDYKISKISATATLLSAYPNAKVITMVDMPLPFSNAYCQSIELPHLAVKVANTQPSDKTGDCLATIRWYDQSIAIKTNTRFKPDMIDNTSDSRMQETAFYAHSKWVFKGQLYDARRLGQVRLKKTANGTQLSYARQKARAWQYAVTP